MTAQLTQTWYNARVMSHLFADKRLLLCRLCGILTGWLVFLTTFTLVGLFLFAMIDLLDIKYSPKYSFDITVLEIGIIGLLSLTGGIYAAIRLDKYLTKLLKTKSNQTIILVLIALLLFVMITFHWLYIFREI